ncbi:hypothetical protein H9P43_007063 [Blastocladiella emersonii ATCC 22665]|nr:hypothetical protein H9P43_007063 [Blastocladiella emersonii ATCC 22665]
MAVHGQDPVPAWFTRDAHLFLSGHVLEMRDWFEMNRVMGMPEIQYVPVGQPATGIIAVETPELEATPLVAAPEATSLVSAIEPAPLVPALAIAPLVSAIEAAPLVSAPDRDAVEHLAADLAVADSGSQEHLVPAPSAAATSTSRPLSSFFNKFAGQVVDALAAPFKCLRASASLLSLSGTPVAPLTVPEQQLHLEIDTAAVKISTSITSASAVKPAKPLKAPKDSKLRRAARFAFNKVAGIVTRADGLDQGDASTGAQAARVVLEVPSRDLAKALTAPAVPELVKTVDNVRAAARGVGSADSEVLGSAVAKALGENNNITVHNGIYDFVKMSVKGAASLDDAVVQKWIRVAEHCLRSNSDFSTLNAISLALEFIDADKAFTMAPHERRALKRIFALNNVCDKTKGIKMLMENKMVAASSAECAPRMVPLVAPVLATLCTAEVSTAEGSYAKKVAEAVDFFDRVEMPVIAPAPEDVFAAYGSYDSGYYGDDSGSYDSGYYGDDSGSYDSGYYGYDSGYGSYESGYYGDDSYGSYDSGYYGDDSYGGSYDSGYYGDDSGYGGYDSGSYDSGYYGDESGSYDSGYYGYDSGYGSYDSGYYGDDSYGGGYDSGYYGGDSGYGGYDSGYYGDGCS